MASARTLTYGARMLRGESKIDVSARALATAGPPDLHDAAAPLQPVRVQLVRLPPGVSASDAASAIFALHGAAIAHNISCVLTGLDPEGPHQLRIALRRTRVALKLFEPVMRRKANARLIEGARGLGRIVGELRDADVMIDEVFAPAARHEPMLLSALNAWRQEVRGRVRARLLAANAAALAVDFAHEAATSTWLKRRSARFSGPFATLAEEARHGFLERAALLATRLPDLDRAQLHRLRKAIKAARYGAELAESAGAGGEGLPRFKRMQDALGYANDMAALEAFDPPLLGANSALARVRARLVEERRGAVASAIAAAAAEWDALLEAA